MKSKDSYIIDRRGHKPQVHIIVIDSIASSDDEIRDIVKRNKEEDKEGGKEEDTKEDIVSKEWCHNIVVYNLFENNHRLSMKMGDFAHAVSENVRHRRLIRRPGIGGAVGIGPRPDQHGNMGEYRNILATEDAQKFALIQSADKIFDYFIEVPLRLIYI
jgi:hypothetical protein